MCGVLSCEEKEESFASVSGGSQRRRKAKLTGSEGERAMVAFLLEIEIEPSIREDLGMMLFELLLETSLAGIVLVL